MEKRNELVAYAMDFASYLILKTNKVDIIILHGSVARDDFDESSDIDIFIDAAPKNEKKIKSILEDYYKTNKFKEWKLKGVDNSFSLIVGNLNSNEWKNLKRAIINTGIILYGKYKSNIEKINFYVLFSFENIKPDKKRISIFRKLFGFKVGKKKYSGMIEEMKGVKVGKGSILVPIEHANELKKYLQTKRIKVKLYEMWSDYKLH